MKQLDLLNGKILPTMLSLATPLMATAFIQMFYTLTDMAWIGRISTEAVAAAGVVGFLMWIASSLALIPRVGLSVLTAQFYGNKQVEDVKLTINNGFWMGILIGLIYGLLLIIFREPLINFYQLEAIVNQLAIEYLVVIAAGMVLFFINPVLSGAYNALGNSRTPFRINAIGLLANIVGDPILIFGLGPFPAMGIRGAAIATVFSQLIVFLCFILVIYRSHDILYHSKLWLIKFDSYLFKNIFVLGFPVALQSSIHALISIILNRYVAIYGAVAVAVTSIGSNIESISWMTTEGFASAITAMTAQNYGGRRYPRLISIYYSSLSAVATIGFFATLVLIVFRYDLFQLFLPGDAAAVQLGAVYLYIFGLSQLFMCVEIGLTGFLNGISDTRTPALINTLLNLLRIPMALLFMTRFNVAGIWIAMSLSSVFKGIILYVLSRVRLQKIKRLKFNFASDSYK